MPALFGLIEVDEVVVGVLYPVAWRLEELPWEHRVGDRELDVRRRVLESSRRAPSGLPVQPRGGSRGVRHPVQRDVVEDVVAGEVARRLSVEKGAGDLLVAVCVVVEHPGRQTEG